MKNRIPTILSTSTWRAREVSPSFTAAVAGAMLVGTLVPPYREHLEDEAPHTHQDQNEYLHTRDRMARAASTMTLASGYYTAAPIHFLQPLTHVRFGVA